MYGTDTSSSGNIDPLNALSFFRTVGKLKLLKRTGWVNHGNFNVTSVLKYFSHTFNISIGIPLPESVADHMYRSQINPRFNTSDIL
jgi:5'-deoxynucleotidase YfbR-like HD superfamily hydrolase